MLQTVPGNESLETKCDWIKAAGLDGFEPLSHLDQKRIRAICERTGLQIPSVCCSTHGAKPITDPDPSVRKAGVEGLKQALHDAQAYGARSVLFVPGNVNKNVPYETAWKRAHDGIAEALPLAAELKVKIAIENIYNMFLLSPLEAVRFVDEFKSPWVGWHFDIGNVMVWGWAEDWIRTLGRRIVQLHIKEYSRKKRDFEGVLRGAQVDYLQGDNDWPTVMKALDEVGYQGWAIAEPAYYPPELDDAAKVRHVSEAMDRILAS